MEGRPPSTDCECYEEPDDIVIHQMTDKPTPGWTRGIDNVTRPAQWLVPPWRVDANVFDVIGHFNRHEPWHSTEATPENLRAFHVGFAAALRAATTEGIEKDSRDWRLFKTIQEGVEKIASRYEKPQPATHQETSTRVTSAIHQTEYTLQE